MQKTTVVRVRRAVGRCALVALVGASAACEDKAPEGGVPCKASVECDKGFVCSDDECVKAGPGVESVEARAERWRREIEAERIADLEKQVDLLRQSGVEPDVAVEQPDPRAKAPAPVTPQAARGGALRVSTTKGDSPIFAACRPDERLVGGGCRATTSSIAIGASYPSEHSENDTLGARWNCEGRSDYVKKPLEAYALCRRVGGEN